MGEELERWTDRTPERRHPLGLAPTSGVVGDAVVPAQEIEPAGAQKPRRERGPFMTYLCLPWSYGDREPSQFWHRLRCRCGRHDMSGGEMMHLAGAVVFVDRRCRWCGVMPGEGAILG